MQYIVLDLEWNQPVSYASAAYRKVGEKLLFEVIQIGAAKVNERMELVDTTSVLICPTHYLTIHPRVKRMTGITQELICDAPHFAEGANAFLDWCGEDCVCLTWGGDDISVFQQNMDFFGVERKLPPMYDLQRLYAAERGKGGQVALKTAMEELEIQPEEDRAFHNAMHDAYYTARVWQKLPHPAKVLEYEEHARKLSHNERRVRFRATENVKSVTEALASDKLTAPRCPTCGQATQLKTELIPQAPGKFIALSQCKHHGTLFVKAHFAKLPDGQVGMHLSILPANKQARAYIHTKELQYQYKRKRGDYEGTDWNDLSQALSTNMPFEDA